MTAPSHASAVAAAFGAAADTYESDAGLQRLVAERLGARIAALPLPIAPAVLEIGCGTGFLSREVAAQRPDARWLITDLSEAMVRQCRQSFDGCGAGAAFLVMDGARPGLDHRRGGFDLICSSLALQWFADPGAALSVWAGLLRPGGYLAFTTLVAGTFAEWNAAHAALGLASGVPDFATSRQLAASWPAGGEGRVEVEARPWHYADGHAFRKELRAIGAHSPAPGRRPLPPGALRRVLRQFAAPSGLSVTYQVAYGWFRKDGAPP